jgi:cell division protein FtsB
MGSISESETMGLVAEIFASALIDVKQQYAGLKHAYDLTCEHLRASEHENDSLKAEVARLGAEVRSLQAELETAIAAGEQLTKLGTLG